MLFEKSFTLQNYYATEIFLDPYVAYEVSINMSIKQFYYCVVDPKLGAQLQKKIIFLPSQIRIASPNLLSMSIAH